MIRLFELAGRACVLALAMLLASVVFLASPASAETGELARTLTWVDMVTLLVTVLVPLLVGLVTTRVTNSGAKAMLLAGLSAVVGFGNELLVSADAGDTFAVDAAVMKWAVVFVIAVATHFGLWKPTGVSGAAQDTGVTPK